MHALRLLLAAALLVPLLAGCSDEPEAMLEPTPVDMPMAPVFAPDVVMPQAAGAGEPNIAILPDGTLFVTAPVGGSPKPNVDEGAAYLWRSTDEGQTWTVVRSPHVGPSDQLPQPGGAFCSCDADVTTSPDGWVYYSDWWIAGAVGPGNYMVEASGDSGESWASTPVTIPQDLLAGVDRQWLVAGEDGLLGLFYSFYSPSPAGTLPIPAAGLDRAGQAILAVFSSDHGQTFGDPVAVVPAEQGTSYQIAHPFLAPNGTLMMAYGRVPDGDTFWLDESEVRLAWSTDHGATWQDKLLADVPLGFDNLWAVQGAVDASTGQSTVVWASRLDGVKGDDVAATSHMGISVLQFGPLGTVGPVLVRANGTNFLPWAAARDGTTAVGWYGGDATGDVTLARGDAAWYTYVAKAHGGLFTPGNITVSIVSTEPVKTGPLCPKGAACDGDRELLDYVSLVFDDAGLLHYAFASSRLDEGAFGGKNAYVHVANELPPLFDL
ncbi:MAG TPA: sialidase family protein [Candidatus Thermoplasmatota archaeon]|nr:sialidase family protein [Candidatus Thermoplasmatota archaeon]